MEKERWRFVKGFEGLYLVSDLGRVMGLPKKTTYGRLLTQCPYTGGYLKVCLCKNNVKHTKPVHRLVAESFIPNAENKPEVNHKNGVRTDNRATNLEWVTRSENELHAYRTLGKTPSAPWRGKARRFARRFSDDQVKRIRLDQRPNTVIGAELGVSKTTIANIKKRKVYTDVN